jgi:heme oxygenase
MSPALLPDLPTFAHALGALYVLEGATLGGRVILRDLDARLGTSIAGATRFFGGRREAVGPMWLRFRALLDDFGRERPELHADVTAGAQHVFRAMLVWFAPFCAVAAGRP